MSPKKKQTIKERFFENPITTIAGILVIGLAIANLAVEWRNLFNLDWLEIAKAGVILTIGIVLLMSPDLFIKKFWSKDLPNNSFKDRP